MTFLNTYIFNKTIHLSFDSKRSYEIQILNNKMGKSSNSFSNEQSPSCLTTSHLVRVHKCCEFSRDQQISDTHIYPIDKNTKTQSQPLARFILHLGALLVRPSWFLGSQTFQSLSFLSFGLRPTLFRLFQKNNDVHNYTL